MGDIFHALSTRGSLSLWMFILPLCALPLFSLASCFCLNMINHFDFRSGEAQHCGAILAT